MRFFSPIPFFHLLLINSRIFNRNLEVWQGEVIIHFGKQTGEIIYYAGIVPMFGVGMLVFAVAAGVIVKWVISAL